MDRSAKQSERCVASALPASAVAAVIVSHHPPPGLSARIAAVAVQCGRVYLLDNASPPGALDEVTALLPTLADRLQLIGLPCNLGLAAALNRGVAQARSDGFALAWLLDHDSTPEADALQRLLAARAQWPEAEPLLALVPELVFDGSAHRCGWPTPDSARGWRLRQQMADELRAPLQVLTAFGSGLLVDIERYTELGGMREELFIDGVDTDFCLRGHARGWPLLAVPGARLHHRLGALRRERLWGIKDFWPTDHSPQRLYYIARNRILLQRIHGRRYPGWFVFAWRVALIQLLAMLLFEQQRAHKLAMLLLGSWHGVLGRHGKREFRR